jgi:anaerobic dimethyl sulfoxide reductase subunit C
MAEKMIQGSEQSEQHAALVGFTALAPLAVGGFVGLLVVTGLRLESGVDWAAVVVLATGLLALIVSLLHLGRPWRAPLALLRLGNSWLSREILLFGLFLIAVGCYAILPVLNLNNLALYLVGLAGAIIGLAGTVATGATYRLHARPSWDQWLSVVSFPLGALSAGLLFGLFVAGQFTGHSSAPSYAWGGAALVLIAALLVTWLRSTRRRPESVEGGRSRQLVIGPYRWLLIVRLLAGILALVLIGTGGILQFYAWVPALLGEFADRVLFFNTVVPVTFTGHYL